MLKQVRSLVPVLLPLLALAISPPPALAQEKPAAKAQPLPANPKVFDIARVRGGVDVPYLISFPTDYKPGPPYPVLIYFGDTTQDKADVVARLSRWETEASSRQWVIVGIAKPSGNAQSLTTLQPDAWAGVLEEIGRVLPIKDGQFYLAGSNEGGKAALYLGGLVPDKVKAVLSLGAGAEDWFMGITVALKDRPVAMVVGEQDKAAMQASTKTVAELQGANAHRAYQVLVPGGADGAKEEIDAARVFELLTLLGEGKPPILNVVLETVLPNIRKQTDDLARYYAQLGSNPDFAAAAKVLDDLHDAAAKADETRYFNLYAPNAVFLGTDAKERWTLDEFKAFAHPYFAKGKAWTYTPVKDGRFIVIEGQNKDVAWFDEKLENAKLGLCRGSGVLIKINGVWKVKQYNLTMLVPNEIAEEVATKSRAVR
jgi:pimeloyl-ACP methyl ester carboxylesterase